MIGNEIIVLVLLIAGCFSADDISKTITLDVTPDATSHTNKTITSTTISTFSTKPTTEATKTTTTKTSTITIDNFPLLEDLISAERSAINDGHHDDNFDNEKNTAKRTISSKFTGPIVVNEDANLFTPSNEFSRKQRINVQIIEPESHNNGQFLQQTVYLRQENNTVVTSKTTTTSTTERPTGRKIIFTEPKFSTPIQVSQQLTNDRQRQLTTDEDCDDDSNRANNGVTTERARKVLENVNIHQNTKIQKVVYKEGPKQNLVYGARIFSTTRPPCDQSLPCSTVRAYKPSPTPRLQPIHTTPLIAPRVFTTPRIITTPRIVVSTPRVVTTPAAVATPVVAVTPIPVQPLRPVSTVVPVTEKPVYIHTHSEVPVIHKEFVHLPPKIIEKPVIHKEFVQLPPQVQIVEKPKVVVQKEFVQLPPQEKFVEVEKLVVKEVNVPINNVIEKHIQHPPTVVEKLVPYPVNKPIEVERIIEVPVDREKIVPVNHIVEKPVPVVQYVDRPIHIPYILPVEIPVAYHVPYLVKSPPPPQKQHFIIKTTKYGKGHIFDWKHDFHKHIKHVFVKKPNHILPEDIIAPPTIDSIGLLPPPRYQPYSYSDNFGPTASASINVVHAVLPNTVHSREHFFEPSPIHNNAFNTYDNKIKYVDSFSKDIRWEFGFKPPLVPSVAIDEFGNPLNEHK